MSVPPARALVDVVDAYLDAAPRPDASIVDAGPFTLFVSRTPWPYYARPALAAHRVIEAADLGVLRDACERNGVTLAIEWLAESHPELAQVAATCGLAVTTMPLLVSGRPTEVRPSFAPSARLRVVSADDPALLAGRGVAEVSFRFGGTGVGAHGAEERDAAAAALTPALVEHLRYRARSGLTVTAVGETAAGGVVAVASYQPVGAVAEIVGVATLPSARRQGLAGALTALLTAHAQRRGVRTVLLSAGDDEVAAIYQRAGFKRVATAGAAASA